MTSSYFEGTCLCEMAPGVIALPRMKPSRPRGAGLAEASLRLNISTVCFFTSCKLIIPLLSTSFVSSLEDNSESILIEISERELHLIDPGFISLLDVKSHSIKKPEYRIVPNKNLCRKSKKSSLLGQVGKIGDQHYA
jgi:hypothetical protein